MNVRELFLDKGDRVMFNSITEPTIKELLTGRKNPES